MNTMATKVQILSAENHVAHHVHIIQLVIVELHSLMSALVSISIVYLCLCLCVRLLARSVLMTMS